MGYLAIPLFCLVLYVGPAMRDYYQAQARIADRYCSPMPATPEADKEGV